MFLDQLEEVCVVSICKVSSLVHHLCEEVIVSPVAIFTIIKARVNVTIAIIIIWTLEMTIWVERWSKRALVLPIVPVISGSVCVPGSSELVSVCVTLHFLVKLIWVHAFPLLDFRDLVMINDFSSLLLSLQICIFNELWQESIN